MSLHMIPQRMADAVAHCFETEECHTGLPTVSANQDNLSTIMQLTFGIVGAVAVIIIIVAGLTMISAQGDPQKVAKSRQTVIYAAVGLAVAISAEAIVVFTVNKL